MFIVFFLFFFQKNQTPKNRWNFWAWAFGRWLFKLIGYASNYRTQYSAIISTCNCWIIWWRKRTVSDWYNYYCCFYFLFEIDYKFLFYLFIILVTQTRLCLCMMKLICTDVDLHLECLPLSTTSRFTLLNYAPIFWHHCIWSTLHM